jgi:ubiquinone biosynthesis protein
MMKLMNLPQFRRDAARFREIVAVLAKYGLANWLEDHEPGFIQKRPHAGAHAESAGTSHEARVRMAFTDLGTTFIKLGQIMSTREDLVGPALAGELAKLQSSTPADPPEVVATTFAGEIGSPPEKVFAEFDFHAVASASIGQIHFARLSDGQPVVVKIQHAGIERKIIADLDILMTLAQLAEKVDADLLLYQPRLTLSEFRRSLLREIDFSRELKNLEQFARNFAKDESVRIPRAFAEMSTRRVLTMERLEGFSIADKQRMRQEGIAIQKVAVQGARIFLDMIFRDKFYHADPHPGNIWIQPDGRIGLLDFGMVGRLDVHTSEDLEEMLLAAVHRDAERITEFVLRIGIVPDQIDRSGLQDDISAFVDEYVPDVLNDFDLSGALRGLTRIVRDYHVMLPSKISLLLKVLIMLEGTSRTLSRNFNLAELLKPYQTKLLQQKYSPQMLLRRIQRTYREWERLLDMLPGQLTDTLQHARDGRFNIHLEHRRLDTIVNRLVYGILTAALFLGSCQLLGRKIPPLVADVSVLGAGGCLIAVLLGIQLFKAIRNSGSLDGS